MLTLVILTGAQPAAGAPEADQPHLSRQGMGQHALPLATLTRTARRVILDNGYAHVEFDLTHPQIDVLRADYNGQGAYGPNLLAPGPDPSGLQRRGILLERDDVDVGRGAPAAVWGLTDHAHAAAGQLAGRDSYAAELLPPPGTIVSPPGDAPDATPLRMPDATPAGVIQAHGQTLPLAPVQQAPYTALHLFGAATGAPGGVARGVVHLTFADGHVETPAVVLPDWGCPTPNARVSHPPFPRVAFRLAYRHSPGGDEAVPTCLYHAIVPLRTTSALRAITLPAVVTTTAAAGVRSVHPATLTVLALTLRRADGAAVVLPLVTGWRAPVATHASSAGAFSPPRVTVLMDSPGRVSVRIDGLTDDPVAPLVTSTWTLSLSAGARAFTLDTTTRALSSADDVAGLRLSSYLAPRATYGFFARGVVQIMDSYGHYFASDDPLRRFYALGGGGSVDVTTTGQARGRETLLMNARGGAFFRSGLQQVLAGRYPVHDTWGGPGWANARPARVMTGETWRVDDTIAVNNDDFPVGALPPGSTLPVADLRAIYTAIYGSSAGALDTYHLPGEVATTLAAPWRGYPHDYNFFDPDTWMTVSALVYSGDPYLQHQARTLIETSGARIRPDGQVPHHFVDATPAYVALSGATLTGPNIFWIAAALQYVRATGDYGWLRLHMPALEHALDYLTRRYDPRVGLVDAPGPLWIDVFIRDHYASDTNAYMVEILREMADAERFLATPAAGAGLDTRYTGLAARHAALARAIAAAMNARLWAGDHYITQLNPDGTIRDFVDADANLLAVAFGIAPPDRAALILRRIDASACAEAPRSSVAAPLAGLLDASQVSYGPADTYHGNLGDSSVAMGRIGWADGRARARVGDLATFNTRILDPVRAALLAHTWLTERSTCAGALVRARYDHEYPEMVVMLLREVAYGINLGLRDVRIDPFGHARYHYHIGDVDVAYSPTAVSLTVPGSGDKRITLAHLVPTAVYAVRATNRVSGQRRAWVVTTDAGGTLTVTAPIGLDWQLRATVVRRAPATPRRSTHRSVHPARQPASIDLGPYLDNTGVTDDTDTDAATFDHAGNSYSRQALAAPASGRSLVSGARVTIGGALVQWPRLTGGSDRAPHRDNVIARDQTITLPRPLRGSALYVVGATVGGPVTERGLITYTDATTQCVDLSLGNWIGRAAAGNTIVARQAYHNNRALGSSRQPPTRLYEAMVGLNTRKWVTALRLPARLAAGPGAHGQNRPEEHIFALAIAPVTRTSPRVPTPVSACPATTRPTPTPIPPTPSATTAPTATSSSAPATVTLSPRRTNSSSPPAARARTSATTAPVSLLPTPPAVAHTAARTVVAATTTRMALPHTTPRARVNDAGGMWSPPAATPSPGPAPTPTPVPTPTGTAATGPP